MSIQRYDLWGNSKNFGIEPKEHGTYVKHDDHLADNAKDLAEIERYKKALEWMAINQIRTELRKIGRKYQIFSIETYSGRTPLEAIEAAIKAEK